MNNVWRSLDLSFISCEIEINIKWTKICAISEISITFRAVGDLHDQEVATVTTEAIFQINNAKFYVGTLSVNSNMKYLENIQQGFKKTISWRKYRSEITTQRRNNNLDYLINLTFRNINRLFVFSLKKWW